MTTPDNEETALPTYCAPDHDDKPWDGIDNVWLDIYGQALVDGRRAHTIVETTGVLTTGLGKYLGYPTRNGHRSWRNAGRKPRMKYRPSMRPKPLHPLDLARVLQQSTTPVNRYGRWGIIGDGVE